MQFLRQHVAHAEDLLPDVLLEVAAVLVLDVPQEADARGVDLAVADHEVGLLEGLARRELLRRAAREIVEEKPLAPTRRHVGLEPARLHQPGRLVDLVPRAHLLLAALVLLLLVDEVDGLDDLGGLLAQAGIHRDQGRQFFLWRRRHPNNTNLRPSLPS